MTYRNMGLLLLLILFFINTAAAPDTTPPVITLNGNNPETIQAGTSYSDAGATVTDNYDKGLTATLTGSVNTTKLGVYTLTYYAIDSSGNPATRVTRTVNVLDTTPPVWSPPPSNQTHQVGVSFIYDVNAKDGSTITYSIDDSTNFAINSSTGEITNKTELSAGNYGLNITVTDALDNSVSQIITVTIQEKPTYSVNGYVFDDNNAGLRV
jgi:hypothetical protein